MNPLLLRAFLAVLPVLDRALDLRSALVLGLAVLCPLFAASLVFFTARPALPASLHRLGFFLLALVLILGVGRAPFTGLWGQEGRIFLPLLILLPPEFFSPRRNWNPVAKHLFFSAFVFWGLLALHGMAAGFPAFSGRFEYFRLPAGSYFLLGLLAWGAQKK